MSPFLASVAIAASQLKEAPLRVMDFGGGSGHYRAYVETAFRGKIQTNWTVVETPEQADHNSDAAIEFSSSIPSRHFDLAIFSSSLQYVPDWTEPLSKVASDLIYIARTPFAADERSFLQTVISAGERPLSYPGRIINRQELFDLLGRTHDLFASWHFDVLLGELGSFDTPAMLWQRR